ncbi:DUF4906 domain-containing protein [Xylanibacter oryzae]|uniref:DUF4906 domain-containing protein n=1 Tax=Xylanibacter oryzae TaxID=185293 RepID=UPI0004B259EC|nr:DUF4906 domain-containing protein [Xylanibacter oryzae]
MVNLKNSGLMVFFLSCILILFSCNANYSINDENGNNGITNLKININVPEETNITRTVSDATINDINAFIFDNDGFLIGHSYTTNVSSITVPTRLINTSTCTICVVANYGSDITTINTLDGLRKIQTSITSASDIANKSAERMYGETSSTGITSGATINVTLLHLYSKYTFVITPKAGSGITVTSYQLCNVSNTSYLYPFGTTMVNPSSNFPSFASVTTSAAAEAAVTTPTYYIYENYPGLNKNDFSDVTGRNSTNAPSNSSYLVVTAQTSTWNSTYYIYLGGKDATNDYKIFNIPRDYNFTYNIAITGSGATDARVSYKANIYYSSDPSVNPWSPVTPIEVPM